MATNTVLVPESRWKPPDTLNPSLIPPALSKDTTITSTGNNPDKDISKPPGPTMSNTNEVKSQTFLLAPTQNSTTTSSAATPKHKSSPTSPPLTLLPPNSS